ncbi:MAG: peptidoglycan editing factor PgeF [Firmicutes bacterium]|nr:peptidoglycan editing factor PgeF [Bacillota bacterium]
MWEKREKNGLIYYTLPAWEKAGAKVVATTRFGGVSKAPCCGLNLGLHVDDNADDVVENRRLMLDAMGSSAEDFVTLKQVHGKRILKADASYRGRGFASYDDAVDDTDGVFTAETHVLMATFYADCLPLAVFHPEKKILGLAHAGWKGTYQNIGGELMAAMRETADFDPEECWCALGAGIGSCCYEVDDSFYQRFCERYDMAEEWFTHKDGAFYFDNVKANIALFMKNGVKKENIEVLDLCTACHNDMFFSYRKEHGQTGRHGLWGELI